MENWRQDVLGYKKCRTPDVKLLAGTVVETYYHKKKPQEGKIQKHGKL
jgi:hypothetical protein